MKRRALTIALAVLLALLGTGGVLAYVNNANARALAGQQAVTVLVAHQLIPAGTAAGIAQAQGLLSTERLPSSSVPADALSAISPGISALVTDADVQPGQLLLRAMLVTSAQDANGLAVPQGMVAVAIQFCVPEAVAGHLQPGAQVAVFATTTGGTGSINGSAACSGSHTFTGSGSVSTKLVLPRVTVLAVGQGTSGQSGSTSSSSSAQNADLITLALSPAEAAQLIGISENGLPYLALLAAS